MSTDIQQALTLSKENKLILEYKGKAVDSEQLVPRHDAPQPPALKYTGTEQGPFLVIALDLDAPFPSAAFASPILHWIQSDFHAGSTGQLETSAPTIASWVKPAPPPFSGPHRYLVLLYKQPASFNAEAVLKKIGGNVALLKRIRWDLAAVTKEYGLTDLVAANYFRSN